MRGEEPKPFSLTSSPPLVRDLQCQGCDVQLTGFGEMISYHAANEQDRREGFRQGFALLRELLGRRCAAGSAGQAWLQAAHLVRGEAPPR